ncbi:alpha/beta fold hydrolase [Shimazuella alba]|uniref:Alpha/beta fold hydrolase n=1 Tax=Shimazuella alba TaxID=2690964 RepID=A0A6I4VN47_9BACL|nr:alpha/beta hydrolase [Shimazuella alba]MXQ52927.1 alpha/beta fold hydrolase [Shimazuella alba]
MMKKRHSFLWISGWSVSSDIWKPFMSQWPNAHHYSLSFENCETVEQINKHAIQTFQQVEHKPVNIIGWSLGAMIALQLAVRFAKDINHLFLIAGVSSFMRTKQNKTGWNELVIKRMKKQLENDVQQVIRIFDQKMFTDHEKLNGDKKKWDKFIRKSVPSVWSLQAGLDFLEKFSIDEYIKFIHTPVSLLSGEEDKICALESTRVLADQLHSCTHSRWDETGHACFWTNQEKFHQWIKEGVNHEDQ